MQTSAEKTTTDAKSHSALHGDDLTTLTAINCRRIDAQAERAQAIENHAANLKRLDAVLEECRKRECLLIADLDLLRIDRARKIINVGSLWPAVERWNGQRYVSETPNFDKEADAYRLAVVNAAIDDLATAKDLLKREYFGLKNYDRFSNQRTDCEYGMGPRHGHITFRVGMTDEARRYPGLTIEQRDDAIYYLRNLARIQRAEGQATKLASA